MDATTCKVLASAAVTCITSFSNIIKGSVKSCKVSLPDTAWVLNKLNLLPVAGSASNKSTVSLKWT